MRASEHQANLQLHQTYVSRGWTVGATFARPGRQHYVPCAQVKPRGFLAMIVNFFKG